MSDTSQGPGRWQGSEDGWSPPESRPRQRQTITEWWFRLPSWAQVWTFVLAVATILVTLALVSVSVRETPTNRARRAADGTIAACHIIGEYLTYEASTGGTAEWFAGEQAIKQRLRAGMGDVAAGDTPEHKAIAAYMADETRRVSLDEAESQYTDPQGPPRFRAMLAACDTLVPDADLTALNTRLVEELKRRYGRIS